MKKIILIVAALSLAGCIGTAVRKADLNPDRITVSGTEFRVGNGTQRIWMNGGNSPWFTWNDFGGKYLGSYWELHFKDLVKAGMNATRVWVSCNGDVGIIIDEDGMVKGATPLFWKHLDHYMETARENRLYVMATLMSFDHFKTGKGYRKTDRWLKWAASPAAQSPLRYPQIACAQVAVPKW